MIGAYYRLTKPGIIYGNLLTVTAGFLLASYGHINLWLLLATLVATSLVIASACVFNNYIDRDIDKLMARTKERALVTQVIKGQNALIYATVLGLIGLFVLATYTNLLTVLVGLIGFIDYVVLYGITKRRSIYGTIVGSIAGATPVVAGYTAVTNSLDSAALILFLILVFWQMPHFYAIAMYRFSDYKAAKIPVLPVKKGKQNTKLQMTIYIIAFVIATISLSVFGYTGYTYLVVMLLLGLGWLWLDLQGFKSSDDKRWARRMFLFSLVVILSLSIMLSLDAVLA